MALWLNRVVYAGPRNGTTDHTVDPSSATDVVAGTPFTPTAGRLLLASAYGGVTSFGGGGPGTPPTGWTQHPSAFVVANGGLYVWHRDAAGGDTFTVTHNGSNFAVFFEVLEFAAGSTFIDAVDAAGVALTGGAGPTLNVAAGTKLFLGFAGINNGGNGNALSFAWAVGVEAADQDSGSGATDRVGYSSAYIEDSTATSQAMQADNTGGVSTTLERLVVAVDVEVAVVAPGIVIDVLKVIP